MLDALPAAFLQAPATAGDPPHRRSQGAAKEETERLPEGTACGALDIAAGQPRTVGGDPGLLASVVASDQVRGTGKALEILGAQLPFTMSRRQLVERVPPRATFERALPSMVQRAFTSNR